MRTTIAHSVRGRLRVRYPAAWLKRRWARIEPRLTTIPGVRAVEGRPLTGSVRIDYDPYRLAEEAIVEMLDELTAELGEAAPASAPAAPPLQRGPLPTAPLLKMLGATGVL